MFGANKPAGGGLFGNQTQTQSTGLFGQNSNTGSGFLGGSNQNQPASTGLFGKPAGSTQTFGQPSQPQNSGTSLFGQSQPQQPSLFGQNNNQQQQPQTGLFGNTNNNNTNNQQQPGGIFGQSGTGLQSQQGNSLFGGSNNQTQSSGGLFGNTSSTQPPQQSGGIFGQTSQQPQQSGGIFGSSNSTAQSTSSGGLFGANKPLFGNAGSNNTPSTNGPFSLGGNNTQQSQQPQNFQLQSQQNIQQQAQQQNLPTITPFTRPGDMPEQFQKELQKMESYIRGQQQLSEDLRHATIEHRELVESIPQDVQLVRFKFTSARETLLFDDGQLAKLKGSVDQDFSDGELLADVVNQPRKYDRLLPYFHKKIDCENRLEELSLAMRDVRHVLTAEEFGKRVTYGPKGVAALPGALKEEHLYFMSLSDRVAELHRHVKENKEPGILDETH